MNNTEKCRTPPKYHTTQAQFVNSSGTIGNSGGSNSNCSSTGPYSVGGQMNCMTPTNRMFNRKAGTFSLLPVVKTPPSRFVARVKNPFDAALTDRLHLPTIHSPLFRKSLGTPRKNSTAIAADKFEWTIDEIASLSSVHVEPCETQFLQTPDPDREAKAQSAISLFFQQTDIVPSPIGSALNYKSKKNANKLTEFMMTDNENSSSFSTDILLNPVSKKTRRDSASQTVLTLPPILPKSIDNLLREYFTYNEDQQQNLGTTMVPEKTEAEKRDSILRRKLLFDHSSISMKSCDNEDDDRDDDNKLSLADERFSTLSPAPQSPDIIVATINSPTQICLRFADIHSDGSETKIVIPNGGGNTSFEAISPIASQSPPLRTRRLTYNSSRKRGGSDSSIDIFQSTPDRLTYASTSMMEIGGSSEAGYGEPRKYEFLNQTVDDLMQISHTSSMNNSGDHPTTPLRSRNRSANRKNLSRSFILFNESVSDHEDQHTTSVAAQPTNKIAPHMQRTDSGYDESSKFSNKNIYLNDVSMKSDINTCLLSSTPSKVMG